MARIPRTNFFLAAWCCLLSLSVGLVATQRIASRAYTPVTGPCPEDFTLVRTTGSPGNQTLSAGEYAYIQARRSQVIPEAWKAYLANVEETGTALPAYVSTILTGASSQTPNVGIAISGGGYRAAIFGAGVLNVLDGRNATSNAVGFGGLLQSLAYTAGLSGGAWFITSFMQANFPTMQELIFGYANPTVANDTWGGWHTDYNILAPSANPITDVEYLIDIVEELWGKHDAGYAVTTADLWSRLLARHFVNGTFDSNFENESYTHGAGNLWSSVAETESFTSYRTPFPIAVADLTAPGQNDSNIIAGNIIPVSNPVFEFNVYEMGSYDPMLSAFTPTRYLGTRNNSDCVTNYDQTSSVAASSSDVFNEFNFTEILESFLGPEISVLSSVLSDIELDVIAASWPNAFYGVAPDTFVGSNQTDLRIVDGGENGENIPLQPLLVQARGVDTILAIDASADTDDNFVNGTSLIVTQERVKLLAPAYAFPPVPTTADEFLAQNLTRRPVFFGCDVTSENVTTPLVIYIANGGPPNGEAPVTNTSSFQMSYSASEVQAMLDQVTDIATQGFPADASETSDSEWPACLACAVVDRARGRAGETRSGVCESCFERYCWSGYGTADPSEISSATNAWAIVEGLPSRAFRLLLSRL